KQRQTVIKIPTSRDKGLFNTSNFADKNGLKPPIWLLCFSKLKGETAPKDMETRKSGPTPILYS
ncbi:TFL1b, partial [Sesbania bispinosa]